MEDENTNKDTPDEKGKEDTVTTPSVIEQAEKLHQDIKAENDRREALIDRDEALQAKKMLGGRSDAGQATETKKEETPKEYRTRVEKEMAEGKTEFGN